MMKTKIKSIVPLILIVAMLLLPLLSGCTSEKKFESGSSVEAKVKTAKSIVVGDASKDGSALAMPENTFDEDVTLTLKALSSEESKTMQKEGFSFLGRPVSVKVEGKTSVRLNQPAVVTIAIPKSKRSSITSADDVYAAYYTGSEWEYFFPDSVDLEKGLVSFHTYHFSDYAVGELSREQQLKQFAVQMATNSWAREQQEQGFINATEAEINNLFSKTLGIENKNVTKIILQSIVKENDFGALLVSLSNNDGVEFSSKLSEMAGKALFNHMRLDATFIEKTAAVTTAYAKAAGQLTQGDSTEAMKTLSSALLDTNVMGKIFKVGVEVTDTAIKDWRDKSIEDAYQAYKNGSEQHGYSVEQGDFDKLRLQMRGIGHKIYSDGIAAYCLKNGVTDKDLSEKQLNTIRNDVDKKLKQEFDSRIVNEKKVDGLVARQEKIIEAFDRNLLLKKGSFGYDTGMSLELRLNRLSNVMNNILDQTGRKLNTGGTAAEGEISIDDMCTLMGVWYNDKTPTKTNYFAELKKLGLAPSKGASKVGSGEYAWVLKEVVDFDNAKAWAESNTSKAYAYEPSYARGSYSAKTSYKGATDTYYKPPYVNGEALAVKATWSTPPQTIRMDETVSLNASIGVLSNTQSAYKFEGSTSASFDEPQIRPGKATRGAINFVSSAGKSSFKTSFGNNYATITETVTAKPKSGSKEGEQMALIISFYTSNSLGTIYIYEWTASKSPINP